MIRILPVWFLATSCLAGEFAVEAILRDETALNGAHDVEVRDGYAYAAGKGGSLAIIDVHDPVAPRIVWSVRDPAKYEDAETVLPLGDRLLIGTCDLLLFNIAERSNPKQIVMLKDREKINRINGFVQVGNMVLGANKDAYLVAALWNRGDDLRLFGTRSTAADGLSSPHDLDVVDQYLVVADGNGFGRNDKSGRVGVYKFRESANAAPLPPEQWSLVGKVEDVQLAGCNRIRILGKFAVAACSLSPTAARQPGRKGSTQIIDLADPTAPRIVASIPFDDTRGPNGLTIAGRVAFVCGGRLVQAIGLDVPMKPQLLGAIDLTKELPGGDDDLHDPAFADGRLFVTAQTSHALVVLRFNP